MPSTETSAPLSGVTTSDSIGSLYHAHHVWLTNWLRHKLGNQHDAADLAQDTFVRVMQSHLIATLREPRNYLTTVARGLVVDLWRRRALEKAYLDTLSALPIEHHPSVEAQAIIQEQLIKLDLMLSGLGHKVKQAFLLSVIEGVSYPDIARRLNISERTVGNYLAKAMERCCLLIS